MDIPVPEDHPHDRSPPLVAKRQFIEVDESRKLRQELHNKNVQFQLFEQRRGEKWRQLQEAQRQEVASLQTYAKQHNALVEARYAEQVRQSKQAFRKELQEKEAAMQQEFQQRSHAIQQELAADMRQKEAAMKQTFELQFAQAQVSESSRSIVRAKTSRRPRERERWLHWSRSCGRQR